MESVYIFGHKNPDTDSICSAIAYAHLKNSQADSYIPARLIISGNFDPSRRRRRLKMWLPSSIWASGWAKSRWPLANGCTMPSSILGLSHQKTS